jgi:hypothetical protein
MPMLRTTCLALLLALPLGAPAQETGRTYQIEVVVFEQSGSTAEVLLFPEAAVDRLPEKVAGDVPAPSPDGATGADALPGEDPEPALPEGFGGPIDAPRMEAILRRLNSGGHRVLWHQAWTQRASDRAQQGATPLPILAALGGGQADAGLEGSVELSAGHYLHLGLELNVPAGETGTYTLSQRRRVKINELHYFDHPRIGAVTLVTVPENQPLPGAASAPSP